MRRRLADLEEFGNTLTRHQGKANVVFCDGHVKSPTLKFLFEDPGKAPLVRWRRDHLPPAKINAISFCASSAFKMAGVSLADSFTMATDPIRRLT